MINLKSDFFINKNIQTSIISFSKSWSKIFFCELSFINAKILSPIKS